MLSQSMVVVPVYLSIGFRKEVQLKFERFLFFAAMKVIFHSKNIELSDVLILPLEDMYLTFV